MQFEGGAFHLCRLQIVKGGKFENDQLALWGND